MSFDYMRKRAALKRKKPLPPMSPKRLKESAIYRVRRAQFLAAHPLCMAFEKIVQYHRDHPELPLPPQLPWKHPKATDVHHVHKRGRYYLDESTWMAVSRWSHDWIDAHKKTARKIGLLK